MNHFNICPSCTHRSNCVLTMQKDKVWSCSEYDEEMPNKSNLKMVKETKHNKKQELQIV